MPATAAARISASPGTEAVCASLKSRENREVDPRVEVAERLHLQVREQPLDLFHAAEEHGHDDHRPGALGNPVAEVEARQPSRRHERGHDALDDEHGELAGGEQREQRRDHGDPAARSNRAGVAVRRRGPP